MRSVTTSEAGAISGTSAETWRKRCQRGTVPGAVKLDDGQYLIPEATVREWGAPRAVPRTTSADSDDAVWAAAATAGVSVPAVMSGALSVLSDNDRSDGQRPQDTAMTLTGPGRADQAAWQARLDRIVAELELLNRETELAEQRLEPLGRWLDAEEAMIERLERQVGLMERRQVAERRLAELAGVA